MAIILNNREKQCYILLIFRDIWKYSKPFLCNKFKTVQILNRGISVVQGTRQREKTMTGAKSGFKIFYKNILGNFGWLLSKERIFDEKSHFHQP